MLKQHSRKFAFMQRLIDLAAIFAAWMFAYYLRFEVLPGGEAGLLFEFFQFSPIIIFVTLYFYTRNNLYHSHRFYSWYREVSAIAKANIQTFAAVFVILYFTTRVRMSRLTFVLYFIFALLFTLFERSIIREKLIDLRLNGKNLRHILLIGYGEQIESYVKTLNYMPQAGIKAVGWVDSHGLNTEYGIPEITLEDLESQPSFDMVVISYPSRDHDKLNSTINFLNNHFIPVMMIPDMEYNYLGYNLEEFEGIPLIEINPSRMSAGQQMLKRVMDIVGAVVGMVLLSPLYLIITILVKLTSRGPIFYGQTRMSLDGRTFRMWKFRSMKTDAEKEQGARWASKNDDRRTPIGTFLRKTSLDEIPQFWNVLTGDMSLVGPRPERPVFIKEFKDQIPAYMLRHRVKTGITGWAQVNGWRGDTSIEKRIEFDIYYIKHWSLWFDIRILLLTFIKGFIHKNAY